MPIWTSVPRTSQSNRTYWYCNVLFILYSYLTTVVAFKIYALSCWCCEGLLKTPFSFLFTQFWKLQSFFGDYLFHLKLPFIFVHKFFLKLHTHTYIPNRAHFQLTSLCTKESDLKCAIVIFFLLLPTFVHLPLTIRRLTPTTYDTSSYNNTTIVDFPSETNGSFWISEFNEFTTKDIRRKLAKWPTGRTCLQ